MRPIDRVSGTAQRSSGGGSDASATVHSRQARFATQVHALLLENLAFQRRNARTNVAIATFPVLVCVLLAVMQSVVDSELGRAPFRCGCACVRLDGRTGACAETACGVQYSTVMQALSCAVRAPPRWPALVQVPRTEARALTPAHPGRCNASENKCPTTVLLTGQNRQLAQGLGRGLFPHVPIEYYDALVANNASNSLEYFEGFSRLVLGSSSLPAHVLLMEPALVPNETLYVLQDLCLWNSTRPGFQE